MTGRRHFHSPVRAAMHGFSMIEVLIALVVLAVGLLGLALMQTMNLRYTQSANHRTMATNLAYDLLDQMRANRLSAEQFDAATFAVGAGGGPPCPARRVNTVTVTENITRWQCQVVEALGADASANVDYNAGQATVVLAWGDRIPNEAPTSFAVVTRL